MLNGTTLIVITLGRKEAGGDVVGLLRKDLAEIRRQGQDLANIRISCVLDLAQHKLWGTMMVYLYN